MKESQQYRPVDSVDSLELDDRSEDETTLGHDFRFCKGGQARARTRRRVLIAVACITLFALYTYLVAFGTSKLIESRQADRRRYGRRFLSSPANEFIEYEPRLMSQSQDQDPNTSQFFGEPNEDLDMAWHDLFKHQNLRIKPELMRQLGREDEGILLPDGTYFGSMMVFHHLHCLKNIQHALHPEYYQLDHLEGSERHMFWEHTDHCLHMLMDAVMCQGDTTISTMKWSNKTARAIGNFDNPHECINWNRLMDWVIPNSVDVFQDNMLVHPKFGVLFPDGKPSASFIESLVSVGTGKVHGLDPKLTSPNQR